MTVWAIADLHLSFAQPDRRERYAARWRDHAAKIEARWRETVRPDDLVLLPGDLSMARNHQDLQLDLAWLDQLPGSKILSPGNHDSWWNETEKVRRMMRRSLLAVGGDALRFGEVIVSGARGCAPPSDEPTAGEQSLVDRALLELDQALEQAAVLRSNPEQPHYLLWHYPPFDRFGRPGPWVSRFEDAGVSACVYGHLHIQDQWARTVQGTVQGIRYYCVAADAIGFRPLRIDRW